MLKLLLVLLLARLYVFHASVARLLSKTRVEKCSRFFIWTWKIFQVDQTDFLLNSGIKNFSTMGCCGPNEKERAEEIEKGGNLNF